jgi:hypothetical protein
MKGGLPISRKVEVATALALVALSLTTALPLAADATVQSAGFSIANIAWGTATTSASPAPGDRNVPLTLTLQYYYYNTANSVQVSLSMPPGFTSSDGSSVATAFETSSLTSGTIFQLTFYVNIASWMTLGEKSFPLTITWGAVLSKDQSISLTQDSVASITLEGTPKLNYQIQQEALTPGDVNNITLVLTNRGTGLASDINATVNASVGSVLNGVPDVAQLQPNASASALLRVFIPSSDAGAAITFSFSARYQDVYGNYQHYSQTLGAYVLEQAAVYQVGMSQLSSEITLAKTTAVSFTITNTGTAAIYSPTIALTMPSGLAVTANSTYIRPNLVLQPGQSVQYQADVVTGPSLTQGTYTGTLTVSYMDVYGTTHSQTFSPGVVLVAGIQLVVQDLAAAQAGPSTLTVTGTLLNEGLGSAYYLEVAGSVAGGAPTSSYLGEVDPNTPLPFSIDVPYRAAAGSSKVDLQISATYMNNYGQPLTFQYSAPLTVTGSASNASSTAGSQGSGSSSALESTLRYAILAVILVVVVASALYLRRSRRSSSGKGAKPSVI